MPLRPSCEALERGSRASLEEVALGAYSLLGLLEDSFALPDWSRTDPLMAHLEMIATIATAPGRERAALAGRGHVLRVVR